MHKGPYILNNTEVNMNPTNGSLINGRRIEFFSHESEADWGYDKPQRDSFAIIHPDRKSVV